MEGIKEMSNGGHPSPPFPMSLAIHAWPKLHTPFRKTEAQSLINYELLLRHGVPVSLLYSRRQYFKKKKKKTVFLLANTIVFPGGVPHLIVLS